MITMGQLWLPLVLLVRCNVAALHYNPNHLEAIYEITCPRFSDQFSGYWLLVLAIERVGTS